MTYRKIMQMLNELPINSPQLDEEAVVIQHRFQANREVIAMALPVKRFSPAIAFSAQTAKMIGDNHLALVV